MAIAHPKWLCDCELSSQERGQGRTVDLNEAAREVLAICADELQRHRVIVRQDLAKDLPLATGDRVQLQQVIFNLLRNASDAMSGVADRPRALIIRTEKDKGDCVRLTVQDTGDGITTRDMGRLFDAFYTTKSDGMGIGLFVSRSIIEHHSGRLWATPKRRPRSDVFILHPLQVRQYCEGPHPRLNLI